MGLPLMLLTILGGAAAAAVVAYALTRGRRSLARPVLIGAAVWSAVYFVILLAVSLSSRERTLGWNEPKKFCGFYLDCHTQVAVVDVETTPAVGPPHAERRAAGTFYVVTLEIASDAKIAWMRLANPRVTVVDDEGRRIERALHAEAALGGQPLLTQPLGPGGAYRTKVVFDLPFEVRNPRLLVTRGNLLERASELVLIGDEDSVLHEKTTIRLMADG